MNAGERYWNIPMIFLTEKKNGATTINLLFLLFLSIESLSKDVFEGRTSTGSEPFSLYIYLDANKFVLLSFFSLTKRIYPRVSNKPLPNNAKGPLQVDVRRSTTLLLKLPLCCYLSLWLLQHSTNKPSSEVSEKGKMGINIVKYLQHELAVASLDTRRQLEPKCAPQLFLESLLGTRRSAIGRIFSPCP